MRALELNMLRFGLRRKGGGSEGGCEFLTVLWAVCPAAATRIPHLPAQGPSPHPLSPPGTYLRPPARPTLPPHRRLARVTARGMIFWVFVQGIFNAGVHMLGRNSPKEE